MSLMDHSIILAGEERGAGLSRTAPSSGLEWAAKLSELAPAPIRI